MKLKNALMFITASLILILIACTPPPATPTMMDHAQVEKDVTAIAQAWQNAINDKDLDAQLALFADDMTSYGPNEAPQIGKATLKAKMEENMANDTSGVVMNIKFTTKEVFAGGDYATEVGSWSVSGEDGAVMDKGHYFTQLQKKDDKYMVIRDIWNSEMPKEKPEPMADAAETDAGE